MPSSWRVSQRSPGVRLQAVEQAVALAAEAGVGELVLFHHSPERTDDEARALLHAAVEAAPCPVRLAVEGDELTPGGSGVAPGTRLGAPRARGLPEARP